jgi:hypothetical protein
MHLDPGPAPTPTPSPLSNSEQFSKLENRKIKICFNRGGICVPSFSRKSFVSALSLLLSFTIFLYTIPAPLSAQLPQVPQMPQVPQAPQMPQLPGKPPAGEAGEAAPAADAPQTPQAPPTPQMQLSDDAPPFHITVVEGEGAINNIHQIVNRAATVIIEDENKTPISGVAVTFFLPNDGPSGLFPNGSRVLTVFSDEKGIAMSRPIRFNNLVGIMPIRVSASLFSQSVSATITETNVASGQAIRSYVSPVTRNQEPHGGGIHISKKVWITVAVVGAAGAAGAYFLTRSSPPTATIGAAPTVGTITIGGSH